MSWRSCLEILNIIVQYCRNKLEKISPIILVEQVYKKYWNGRFPFNQKKLSFLLYYHICICAHSPPSLSQKAVQTCNFVWWFAKQSTLWQQPKHKCAELFTMRALALDKDAAHISLLSNFGALFLFVNVFLVRSTFVAPLQYILHKWYTNLLVKKEGFKYLMVNLKKRYFLLKCNILFCTKNCDI